MVKAREKEKLNAVKKIAKTLYDIDLSDGQAQIFAIIFLQEYPRNIIICPTQYGKSFTVGKAAATRAGMSGERFIILAPSQKKAQIIMNYVIDAFFAVPDFTAMLELDPNEKMDRLRRERSRNNITLKNGGGVMTLTLDARNSKRNIESAMGFGGNRLILDESSLIEDSLYATVRRMVGGFPYDDTFIFEIGNPFYRNHFHKTFNDDETYNKLFIDYKQALKEGRFSHRFIDEMRGLPFFDVFYECKFPDEDAVDALGYRQLVTSKDMQDTFVKSVKKVPETNSKQQYNKHLRLGVDIGGGADLNVYGMLNTVTNKAWIEGQNKSKDTMTNVTEVEGIAKKYKLYPRNIFIDDTGLGRGVVDRLKEKKISVNGVSVGEKAKEPDKFRNKKAEIYWHLKSFINTGGQIETHKVLEAQLKEIKYKVDSDKVIKIEPKQDMIKRSGKSPDYADALALCFTQKTKEPQVRFI